MGQSKLTKNNDSSTDSNQHKIVNHIIVTTDPKLTNKLRAALELGTAISTRTTTTNTGFVGLAYRTKRSSSYGHL